MTDQTRPRFGLEIVIIAGILTLFGLITVYSSSSIPAFHKIGDPYYFFRKQVVVAALGFAAIAIMQIIPFKWLHRATLPLFALSLFLLCLTLIPTYQYKANGAARWLSIGPINFQPAELAKLSLILFMAKSLARRTIVVNSPSYILSTLAFFTVMAIPLMLQPDFGSTFLMFTVVYIMLFCANLSWKYTLTGVVFAVIAVGIAIAQAPYRLARLVSFLDPWADLRKGGFQIIQSFLGFQNGGLWGAGVGESKQKLYFLPEAHTDFIISVIGEEFGLFGVFFVITCFGLILHAGFRISQRQTHSYTRFLAIGLTTMICAQSIVNLGVALGILPTKGISLPFVSSGASSLLIFLLAVGILCRLDSYKFEPGDQLTHGSSSKK